MINNFKGFFIDSVLRLDRFSERDFGKSKFVIIVGPNWSGKTSVFQAIKFALGSNERDERYTKWSNFIHHFQKHAMVELHIQNNSELIQLRRTVIGGKSPYYSIKRENDSNFHRERSCNESFSDP